jgi:glycyl-tRNA synthetase beta chain
MNTQSLLIELGTEELPPKALPGLAEAFAAGVASGLTKRDIAFAADSVHALYSPRRLALRIDAVASEQAMQKLEVMGPYSNIACDANGVATPALHAFAKKNGLAASQLQKITDAKGERFVAYSERPGRLTVDILPEVVRDAIKTLPIPKPMRWGRREELFVRPVHWLLALFGTAVVPMQILGLKAGRQSRGHRFHAKQAFDVSNPETYIDTLRTHYVLVDAAERKARIVEQIQRLAKSIDHQADIPEALLDEVNCLVEWPSAVLCQFDPEFLRVPHEALISTMQVNQKFFALKNHAGALSEYFVGIANIESKDVAQIKKGYERVIRPRFADAQFFFDEDLKQGIDEMAESLQEVTYQQQLGSYADKTKRLIKLAGTLAEQLGLDAVQAQRAAALCKADLQSRMVGEFPELQGIAGRYYALAAKESAAVAQAIDEAYRPRFSGDAIAPSRLGQVIAIAERLDTLAGGFAAGLKPSGNKDPFALRRNALGLARTLLEGNIEVDVLAAFKLAYAEIRRCMGHGDTPYDDYSEDEIREAALQLKEFVYERLRTYFAEQGFNEQQFDAVNAVANSSLPDFAQRLAAVLEFLQLPEAAALAAANKRIKNILRKSAHEAADQVVEGLLQEPAEHELWRAIRYLEQSNAPKLQARDYVGVLQALAGLRAPVDAFFESVMVNVEDVTLRGNRLALLRTIAEQLNAVGDIALLA